MDMLESDMKLLLDSLHCSSFDTDQQIEALKTLAKLCNDDKNGDCIRKMGGIELIVDVFCHVSLPALKQWSLYALSNAMQNSRSNKRRLCSTNLIAKISLLLDHREPSTLSVFAANFLLSLCSNFAYAQDLCRESGCLRKLILIFKLPTLNKLRFDGLMGYIPLPDFDLRSRATIPKAIEWFDSPDSVSKSLWTTVSSTLCSMMSDPQNDSNKICCAEVLPQAISALKNANKEILCSALNFISHVVNCNAKTQRMLKLVGGINSLVALLNRNNEAADMPDEYLVSLTLQTISSSLTHYDLNKEIAGSLGIISALIGLIENVNLSDMVQTSCLVCLSRCVDDCDMNANLLLECNGVQTLVSAIVNTKSEEARRIAILILQNSRLSEKGGMSLRAGRNILSPARADVLPTSVEENHIRSKRNRREGACNSDLPHSCGSNAKVNITQNKSDSAILSVLKDHRKILTNVTRHVNELKHRFQEFSDVSSSSAKASRVKQRKTGYSEVLSKSSNRSRYTGRSYFDGVTSKQMLFLPQGGAESENPCAGKTSARNSSLTPYSTQHKFVTSSNRGRKMDMAKRAIMNAHLKSNGSNLFSASKLISMDENSVGCSDREARVTTTPLGHVSCVAFQGPGKGKREINAMSPTAQSVYAVETLRSNMDRKHVARTAKADIDGKRVIAGSKSTGGIQTKNFYVKNRDSTNLRRLSRRDLKRRWRELPAVLESVPMLEQSSYEKVQEWIDASLSAGCTNENETKGEIIDRNANAERDRSVADGPDNSDWENVSSMMMSEVEDQSEESQSFDLQIDELSASAEEPECQEKPEQGKLTMVEHKESMRHSEIVQICGRTPASKDSCIVKHDTTRSCCDNRVESSIQGQTNLNDSVTPPTVLPTRFANYRYKVKRSLAFKPEKLTYSESEESSSPIDMPSEEEHGILREAAPASASSNVHRDGSHCTADSSNNTDKDKVFAHSTSLRDHPIENESSKCLGCFPFARFPFVVLNKRNYIAALRADGHTCDFHGQLIKAGLPVTDIESDVFAPLNVRSVDEREALSIKSVQAGNCQVSKDNVSKSRGRKEGTQRRTSTNGSIRKDGGECSSVATTIGSRKKKRKRQEYEDFEIDNLHKGVQAFGRRWTSILNTYDFKRGRTAEDLKDKYRQLCKRSESTVASSVISWKGKKPTPFTSEEVMNLKIGYGRYGARWKTILNSFKFQNGRTAQDLENRYSRFTKV